MRSIFFLVCLVTNCFALAESPFDKRFYTPKQVVDNLSQGAKGSVQLLWEKAPYSAQYEIQVSNGRSIYSQIGVRNFHHIMIYFDQSYQWRVREVSRDQSTQFSAWRDLKVVRENQFAEVDVDQFVLDTGE